MEKNSIISGITGELSRCAVEFPFKNTSQHALRECFHNYREIFNNYLSTVSLLHKKGAEGKYICELTSDVMDMIVSHAFSVTSEMDPGNAPFAAISLGGYGRRELNPYSDLDILFIVDGNDVEHTESFISGTIQFLWDLNFDLGHSTRTVENTLSMAHEDSSMAASLLDRRFLFGNKALWAELENSLERWIGGEAGQEIIRIKIDERKQRLASWHNTVQIQEPNIKECPGGLRDIHTVRWVSSVARTMEKDIVREPENEGFCGELEFLLRIRNGLHFISGRKSDIIAHVMLPELASNLGYEGEGTVPVENLMHDYYMRTAKIRMMTDYVLNRAAQSFSGVSSNITVTPEGFHAGEETLSAGDDYLASLDKKPGDIIRLFAAAGAHSKQLSEKSSLAVSEALAKLEGRLVDHPEAREAFRDIFSGSGIGNTLRLLHEHGVLVSLIPEFEGISWQFQYDFYHAYTTDEHSLRVVEHLERMAEGNRKISELSNIMADIAAKRALYLAGLLHDVGKSGERGHSRRGEQLASRALKRLQFDNRTIELVKFLIREHLLMSHTAQRRDTDDEGTIKAFVCRTISLNRLRMLTLLTFADMMGLSETVLTEWKKSLIWALYNKAAVLIEKGFEVEGKAGTDAEIRKITTALRGRISPASLRTHLALLPERYMRITPPSIIHEHIEGIEQMSIHGAWAKFRKKGNLSFLTVIGKDHPHALSQICGTITSSDMNIVGARIFTRDDGIIIDTFLVVSGNGDVKISAENQRTFKNNIKKVLSGEQDVRELIATHRRRWRRRKTQVVSSSPRVRVDNEISGRYTVLDVFATDYTGLLYDITSVLAAFGIDIHTARIGTDEDQVADAFYIEKSGGGKITEPDMLEALSTALIERLDEACLERTSGVSG